MSAEAGEAVPSDVARREKDVDVPLLWVVSEASDRLIRDAVVVVRIMADYWAEGRRADPDWRACHERSARRILHLCEVNRGIYIKLGQHVAQLEYLLPEEYVRTLSATLNTAPTSTWADVREVVETDLGVPLESVFASFNTTPVASASLAQVHQATLHDGQRVAVKVQHAGLRETSEVDVRAIEFLTDIVVRVFPDWQYTWLVEEIKANLPLELDFRNELANMKRCAKHFAGDPHVVVPTEVPALCSPRVLTMSFEDGVYIHHKDKVEAMGVDPADVSRLVSEVFCRQIFLLGDVHADPHGGNILVRRSPTGGPELVLLDHGLYKVISDEFRLDYAKLWRALIFGDEDGIRRHSERMNAGAMYQLFASILTTRQWDDVMNPTLDNLKTDRSREGKEKTGSHAKMYAQDINKLLLEIPRDLLLLMKTNDCLRTIDAELGSPVNTFEIMARYCVQAVNEERSQRDPGLVSMAANLRDQAHLELAMLALKFLA